LFDNVGGGVDVRLTGPVTLAGSGVFNLNDRTTNRIFSNTSGDRLTIGSGITIQGSGQLGLGLTTFTNNGIVRANQANGLVIQPGGGNADFTNSASGLVVATGPGVLTFTSGVVNNSGTIATTNGGTMRFNTALNSSGTVNIGAGALTGTGSYTQTGGTFLLSGGTVQLNNALNFQSGLVDARGSINASIQNNALLRPALGGSGLQVTGNVSLLSSSQLVFQLGGIVQGQQYGFMNVSGNVSLGGQLVLSFVNGFQNSVTPNDTFTLVNSAAALAGSFANVPSGGRLLTSDGSGTFQVNYGGNVVTLSGYVPGSVPPGADIVSEVPAPSQMEIPDGASASAATPASDESEAAPAPAAAAPARTAPRKEARPRAVAIRVRDSNELLSLAEDPSLKAVRSSALHSSERAAAALADRVVPISEGFSPEQRAATQISSPERAGVMRARLVP
jgi:hypothetical protein